MSTDPGNPGGAPAASSRRRLLAAAGSGALAATLLRSDPAAAQDPSNALEVNVKEQGVDAVGDDTADDRAAIQAAIDLAKYRAGSAGQDIGRGVVYFPPGTYRVSGVLRVASGITLRGAGRDRSIIKAGIQTSVLGPPINSVTGAEDSVDNVTISDLTLDGNFPPGGDVVSSGLHPVFRTYKCSNIHVARCEFQNGLGPGVALQGAPSASTDEREGPHLDLYFEDCEFHGNGTRGTTKYPGLEVRSSEHVTLVHCYAYENGDRGFKLRGQYVTAVGSRAYNNATWGFELSSTAGVEPDVDETDSYVHLLGCAAEGNPAGGIAVAATNSTSATYATISACSARENGRGTTPGPGLHVMGAGAGALHLALEGGHFISNGAQGIALDDQEALAIVGAIVRSNVGDGVLIVDSPSGGVISGCDVRDNDGWGIRATSSQFFAITGNVVRGNGDGQIGIPDLVSNVVGPNVV